MITNKFDEFLLDKIKSQNNILLIISNIISILAIVFSDLNPEDRLILYAMIPLQLLSFIILYFNLTGKIFELKHKTPLVNYIPFIAMTTFSAAMDLNIERAIYSLFIVFACSIIFYRRRDVIITFSLIYMGFITGWLSNSSITIKNYPELFVAFHILLIFMSFFSVTAVYFKQTYFKQNFDTLNLIKEQSHLKMIENKISIINNMATKIGNEINNPLMTIYSALELIQKKDTLDPNLKVQLEIINKSTNKILKLAKALTLFSNETNSLKEEIIDINVVVSDIVQNFKNDLNSSKININFNRGEKIKINTKPKAIMIALHNIIKNSIESLSKTDSSSLKSVDVHIEKTKENKLKIIVSDTGSGVSQEIIPQLFDPFVSTKRSDTNVTGLGLFTAKGIIQSINGDIKYTTDNQGKTTFIIEIPA